MRKIQKGSGEKKDIFMGIDTHELTYRVSMFFEGEELHNSTYPSDARHLEKLLNDTINFRFMRFMKPVRLVTRSMTG